MKFSRFSSNFGSHAGIVQLMDDLGNAMTTNSNVLMLGGGNPSHIKEAQKYFHNSLSRLVNEPALFRHTIGNYELPQGNHGFISSIVDMLNYEYKWSIKNDNVALTVGSQSAFFYLFNMFGGIDEQGIHKKILLPIIPEYIGYADVGLCENLFYANKPSIEKLDKHFFKYHVNFDELVVKKNTGAMCVSRPTNPTGNVLTDEEIAKLLSLSITNDIPFIIDNAYGEPFPSIIFTKTNPIWNKNIIHCLSLSKLGLPGTRTGIVIADRMVIKLIRNMNAIINLSPPSFGSMIAKDLILRDEILHLSKNIIRPYYQKKVEHAVAIINKEFNGIEYFIHKPEGAIFLWLWLPKLPITSEHLYQRLKKKNVLIIPSIYFFQGLQEDWEHKHQCLRISYSMDEKTIEQGIKLIAKEIRSLM